MRVITGTVMRGAGYGRKLGFPTANLDRREYARRKYAWRLGVYAGVATRPKSGKSYPTGIVLGPRDESGLPKIEAHLIGFSGNLYDKKLRLELRTFLRPFISYSNEDALKKQIAKDLAVVRKLI